MHYGENGILKGAETAVDKYQNKAEQEQNELAKIDDYIQNGREGNSLSETELLKEEVIVSTTTTSKTLDSNVELKESISQYKFLLITYGMYNTNLEYEAQIQTMLLSVKQINYKNLIVLNQFSGASFSLMGIKFKDDKTINLCSCQASNKDRTHFIITSIQGIK